MNIQILYASKKEFYPLINKWPQFEKVYSFSAVIRSLGWPRPSLVLLSYKDKNTKLNGIIKQIKFDFNLNDDEVDLLLVCLEKENRLVGILNFCELPNHEELCAYTTIVSSPDRKNWHVFITDQSDLFSSYVIK